MTEFRLNDPGELPSDGLTGPVFSRVSFARSAAKSGPWRSSLSLWNGPG